MTKTEDLSALYAQWMTQIAANPAMSIDDIRRLFERWGDVTAEPGDCDFLIEDLGDFQAMWIEPQGCARDRVLLCAHGGGYVLGSMYSHRKVFGHFARAVGCRALIVDYRRAPEHAHPGPLEDMITAYRHLIETIAASSVAFLGDSAGGALAITMLLRARELGLPLPAASVALAPYLDTEALGESYDRNGPFDRLGARQATLHFMSVFLGENGDHRDPLANPLYSDPTGLPPIFLQVGGHDVLEDDSVRFHALAQKAGVETVLDVVPEQPHVFQFLAGNTVEADAAVKRAAQWLRPKLGLA